MASIVGPTSPPVSSLSTSSPSLKGIKKVLSSKRRSLDSQRNLVEIQSEPGASLGPTITETSLSTKSAESSPSRDGASSKSGSSGMRKFLPGHAKRKRRRVRDEQLKVAEQEVARGRSPDKSSDFRLHVNRSTSSLTHDGDSSLMTDDEEPETAPPLVSRDSHTGYLTTSSPLIASSFTPTSIPTVTESAEHNIPTVAPPAIIEPPTDSSPTAGPFSDSTPTLPSSESPFPGLVDKANTLRPDSTERGRRGSLSKSLRSKSPARKLKEVFAPKSARSPRTSPERNNLGAGVSGLFGKAGGFGDRKPAKYSDKETASPVDVGGEAVQPPTTSSLSSLVTEVRPQTPTGTSFITPVTTVTPPTPTGFQEPDGSGSPRRFTEGGFTTNDGSGLIFSPSGNMISHRRTRSTSSTTSHAPSKLSSSTLPPLTPTIEESRTPIEGQKAIGNRNFTPGGSFFSSWVSAAQNAATTLTNTINAQNRSRVGNGKPESEGKPSEDTVRELPEETQEVETPKKQLAVETLGQGELNLEHLGLGIDGGGDAKMPTSLRPDLQELRKNSTVRRDEAAAKIEDMLAKRAVSAAYERANNQTPVAELSDPMGSLRHAQNGSSTALGDSPPNGSIFDGDNGSIKRSNSVRSKLAKRRSRGSSIATGTSTIGAALVSASTSTLANPASGPRLSGFAVAPKQRNRTFHQQFRSVPEDDYLIEDYSCALQRDILLAGRIYISEGHICFSSNILGWVTTLVISFEEVVSIERETTAMVFPNAIAIQTLHARHTFRSLLSREATFDLLIGIWKVSHPASFKKSLNGKQMLEQEGENLQNQETEKTGIDDEADSDSGSEESGSDQSDDDEHDRANSFVGSEPSMAGSEYVDARPGQRKPSGMNGSMAVAPSTLAPGASSDVPLSPGLPAQSDASTDFPGPPTHSPTDCTDAATHYEKIIKDEIIPAPLGKIYSLLYGPASGAFVRKYLTEEQKVTDLHFEDDKIGLTNDKKSRQYTYIKPLGGSIGPKQTKCITTENLDFFDLDKAISVTCTTQTPDVPSGNSFSVKTRYCLSWAPGNATRLQMNCGIEWTAKSWLKGPIEKGANDGQQNYGDGLVVVLKNAVSSRARAATGASKATRPGKKRKKSHKDKDKMAVVEVKKTEDWGFFEPVRPILSPVTGLLAPLTSPWIIISFLSILVLISWFRTPTVGARSAILARYEDPAHRIAAYEAIWKTEENELWNWLEERSGVEHVGLRGKDQVGRGDRTMKQKQKERQNLLSSKDMKTRLGEERMSSREMEEAIRVTKERLEVLQGVLEKRKLAEQKP